MVCRQKHDYFVNKALLPQLQPFDGVNSCSIIVLDNAAIHHASVMLPYVRSAGCLIYFLPPYSPDLNPIEYLFSKVKGLLKANDQAWSDYTVQTALTIAFNCITKDDCKAWFLNCGYQ